jgi:hypothetical protein
LNNSEIEALGLKPEATPQGEIIWTCNESFDQARQLNGPAGEHVWNSAVKTTWTNNVARGSSKQINGPVGSEEIKNFFA